MDKQINSSAAADQIYFNFLETTCGPLLFICRQICVTKMVINMINTKIGLPLPLPTLIHTLLRSQDNKIQILRRRE